jgi:hypothetical protein
MGGASGAKDVAVQGKYAYVAGQAGLTIFDVTNPASPDGPWLFSTPSIVNEVEVDGAYAYLSTSEKLYVVNISDPAHVTQVTALDFSASVTRMVKSGNYLYLSLYRLSASIPDSMTIIDVSKPIHPVVRGSYHDPLDPLSGLDISVQEGYAFLVQSLNSMASGKVSLINIANKNAPAELSSYMPGP